MYILATQHNNLSRCIFHILFNQNKNAAQRSFYLTMFFLYYSIKIKIQNTCCLKAYIGPIQGWLPVGPRRYRLIIECSNWIGLVKGVVCPKTNAWYRGSFNAHKGKVLSIVVENQFKSFHLQQNFQYILVTLHNVPSISPRFSYIIIQLK